MARHFICVLSYTLSAPVDERDQYLNRFVVLADFFRNSSHPFWTSEAAGSSVIELSAYINGNYDKNNWL